MRDGCYRTPGLIWMDWRILRETARPTSSLARNTTVTCDSGLTYRYAAASERHAASVVDCLLDRLADLNLVVQGIAHHDRRRRFSFVHSEEGEGIDVARVRDCGEIVFDSAVHLPFLRIQDREE